MFTAWKNRLAIFVFALTLAVTGLVAQSHRAYAGINPPGGYPRYSSESMSSGPDLVDLTIVPHGINPPTRP